MSQTYPTVLYQKRRKTFVSSLNTILEQLQIQNHQNIAYKIDKIVISALKDERESFISYLIEVMKQENSNYTTEYQSLQQRLKQMIDYQISQKSLNKRVGTNFDLFFYSNQLYVIRSYISQLNVKMAF